MSFNEFGNWLISSKQPYKNLDEQRQDSTNAKTRAKNKMISRIVIGVIAVLVVLSEHIPSDFAESAFAFLPVLGLILAMGFPILIGSLFFTFARRKFRQENLYAEEVPEFPDRNNRPTGTRERYSVAKTERRPQTVKQYPANTSSNRDYSGAVDSWDIKDPKPPWEL